MKNFLLLLVSSLLAYACLTQRPVSTFEWHESAVSPSYQVEYQQVMKRAQQRVADFFGKPFPHYFAVYVHPNRAVLDSCWQKDWNAPDFHSECWMVASGVATKLDLLSPQVWPMAACEHRWADSVASFRLFAHELTHVYHGQYNASPDFNNTDRIDWFVEGLAVYASGQCDSLRMNHTRQWLKSHPAPESLDQFWTGPFKYGLCGAVVMYLDQKLGRKALLALLPYNKKEDLLKAMGMRESEILAGWQSYMAAQL